jgi:HK97 family phage portal protein
VFVVTENQLTGLIAPITPYYSTPSEWIQLEQGKLTTFSEIYRSQPAVRSVVDFIASHAARMPLRVYQRREGTSPDHLRDHPMQKLLEVPSGYRPGAEARTSFWRSIWLDFLLYDRVCMVKIRNPDTNNPVALVRVPPVWYSPWGNDYWRPSHIRIIGNRGFDNIPIEDCVYWHGYDPVDPRIGVSPMITLRSMLEEESAGSAWRRRFWENNAQPSMVVTRPMESPDWAEGARDRFMESLRAAANRGKPLMLEEGMTAESADAFNPKSTEYVSSKQFTREEVLRVYNMPMGLFEANVVGSNLGQYRSMLYAETLAPLLARGTDELQDQLLSEYEADPYSAGIYIDPAIEEKMRGNITEQIEMITRATGAPVMLRSEGRDMLNLPFVEGTDELITPLNVLVGNQTSAYDAEPDNLANQNGPANAPEEFEQPPDKAGIVEPPTREPVFNVDEEAKRESSLPIQKNFTAKHVELLKHFFDRQDSAVKSALGAGKPFNQKRWTSELATDLFRLATLTSTYYGTDIAEQRGGTYDEAQALPALKAEAGMTADRITAKIKSQLDEGIDAFASLKSSVTEIARERALYATTFGIAEAARQNGF